MAGEYNIIGVGVGLVTKQIYKAGIAANQAKGSGQPLDKKLYNSELGTPVMTDLTVDPFNYTIDGVTYYVPGIKLYKMLIQTSGNKSIVKTPIQGLDGTVKEYISSGDNTVIIEGCLTGSNGRYPYNEVNDLNKLIDAPVAFKVTSKYLQNLGIDTLVIESFDIPMQGGYYSQQDFKLYCVTDIPVELYIVSSSNTTQ